MNTQVQEHYASVDIVERILAAIPWPRDDDTALVARQLYPFDQLHGRELTATQDHGARLSPSPASHVLDIGSGIGGPARYLATTFGCRVTGIDVTPHFVAAAEDLTDLCGLSDLVAFHQADARAMPFDSDSFDHAVCFYVGMNLTDKPAVLEECHRVLRPGGSLLWTEVTLASGDPHYPLPWSRSASDSHLLTRPSLTALFERAGFGLQSVEDETKAHLELAQRMKSITTMPTIEQRQANEVVLGSDFGLRRKNYIRSLAENRIKSTLISARKP
ncbi:MAG: methyltransferase domain-containing protein [Roseovarius confluentis]